MSDLELIKILDDFLKDILNKCLHDFEDGISKRISDNKIRVSGNKFEYHLIHNGFRNSRIVLGVTEDCYISFAFS